MKHPKVLRRGFIGVNIKPGFVPGGFTPGFATSNQISHERLLSREVIHAAAQRALERRGLGNGPSAFEATQVLPAKLSAKREPTLEAKPATQRLAVSKDTAVSASPMTREKAHRILSENRSEYS